MLLLPEEKSLDRHFGPLVYRESRMDHGGIEAPSAVPQPAVDVNLLFLLSNCER
jgi:hypothetical protein